jgi:hypothetical protein
MVDDRQAMTLRFTADRYEWLREMSYKHRISMQRIVDDALDLYRHTPHWHSWNGPGDVDELPRA